MQTIKTAILRHARVKISTETQVIKKNGHVLEKLLVSRLCSTSTASNSDQVMDRVIELVKQFDRIDASKVTRNADFQKDLSLDSLDQVELVMAFEQEFSIEIPEEKADKFTCCDDVAKYIVSAVEEKNVPESG